MLGNEINNINTDPLSAEVYYLLLIVITNVLDSATTLTKILNLKILFNLLDKESKINIK